MIKGANIELFAATQCEVVCRFFILRCIILPTITVVFRHCNKFSCVGLQLWHFVSVVIQKRAKLLSDAQKISRTKINLEKVPRENQLYRNKSRYQRSGPCHVHSVSGGEGERFH